MEGTWKPANDEKTLQTIFAGSDFVKTYSRRQE